MRFGELHRPDARACPDVEDPGGFVDWGEVELAVQQAGGELVLEI
jgi:hypothetical protein